MYILLNLQKMLFESFMHFYINSINYNLEVEGWHFVKCMFVTDNSLK